MPFVGPTERKTKGTSSILGKYTVYSAVKRLKSLSKQDFTSNTHHLQSIYNNSSMFSNVQIDALGFLKEKRSELVSRVKNIGPILDDMQAKGFHPEMAATVRAQLISQHMMRNLLEATTSTKAAGMLVAALFQHEPHLMEDLNN